MMFQESLAVVDISHGHIQENYSIICLICIAEVVHLVFSPQYKGTTKTYFSERHMCYYLLLNNMSTDENGSCGSGMSVAED